MIQSDVLSRFDVFPERKKIPEEILEKILGEGAASEAAAALAGARRADAGSSQTGKVQAFSLVQLGGVA